ncbi:MAG: hypothetical protein AB7T49_05090 [Oligoflexales bacterium]
MRKTICLLALTLALGCKKDSDNAGASAVMATAGGRAHDQLGSNYKLRDGQIFFDAKKGGGKGCYIYGSAGDPVTSFALSQIPSDSNVLYFVLKSKDLWAVVNNSGQGMKGGCPIPVVQKLGSNITYFIINAHAKNIIKAFLTGDGKLLGFTQANKQAFEIPGVKQVATSKCFGTNPAQYKDAFVFLYGTDKKITAVFDRPVTGGAQTAKLMNGATFTNFEEAEAKVAGMRGCVLYKPFATWQH